MFRFISIILLSILIGQTVQSTPVHRSDPDIQKYFSNKDVNVNIHRDTINEVSIRYIETFSDAKAENLVFLLHGAGSQAMKFKKVMSDTMLLKQARIVALDRPGYGDSSPGKAMVSIEDQTKIVSFVLDQFTFKTCILVGHSYGAAIVANYAYQNPVKDLKLILLAPAIDPELETIFFSEKLRENETMFNIIPQRFKVASYENCAHKEELQKILNIWSDLAIPVYHLHGTRDLVIDHENINFSKSNIDPKYLTTELIKNEGHALLRFQSKKIRKIIAEMLNS